LKVEVYAVVLSLNQSWNWTAGTRTDLAIDSLITSVPMRFAVSNEFRTEK